MKDLLLYVIARSSSIKQTGLTLRYQQFDCTICDFSWSFSSALFFSYVGSTMVCYRNRNFLSDFDDDFDRLGIVTTMTCKYYLKQDLWDFFKFNNPFAINLLHINVRSMKSNFQKIENLLFRQVNDNSNN